MRVERIGISTYQYLYSNNRDSVYIAVRVLGYAVTVPVFRYLESECAFNQRYSNWITVKATTV